MIINDIELDGAKDFIKKGLNPVVLVVRDTGGKSVYDLNDDKLIHGKMMLESHYFIKRDGSILKIRTEEMQTELDKKIFNKNVMLIDIEGNFNVENMDSIRGNSLIYLIRDIMSRFPHLNKIVPYRELYPESNTPGVNFPTAYINELIQDNNSHYIKTNKNVTSINPYVTREGNLYKTRKLFVTYPYLVGDDILTLKYKLSALGFTVNMDNDVYDESLAVVINTLRKKLGLPETGIATIDLMEEIDNMVNSVNKIGSGNTNGTNFTRIIELTVPYMKGQDIKQIQMILRVLGMYKGEIDGVYTMETSDAVKRFQNEYNMEADGIVTPNVWNEINKHSVIKFERLIYLTIPYMSGDDISAIQSRLLALGYTSINVTGEYDYTTEDIVKQFQRNNGLKSDGKITQTVFNKIFK